MVTGAYLLLSLSSPSQEFTVHMESHPIDCSYVIVLVVHLPEQYSMFLFCLPFFLKCIVASITHIGTARW